MDLISMTSQELSFGTIFDPNHLLKVLENDAVLESLTKRLGSFILGLNDLAFAIKVCPEFFELYRFHLGLTHEPEIL